MRVWLGFFADGYECVDLLTVNQTREGCQRAVERSARALQDMPYEATGEWAIPRDDQRKDAELGAEAEILVNSVNFHGRYYVEPREVGE